MRKTITGAALAAMLLGTSVALAADPVCGDVTDDGSIKTTDALLVLKKAVAQPVTLDCSAYDDQFSACQSDLSGCQSAPVCGNRILEGAEECEVGSLDDDYENDENSCVTQGFAGGTLACAAGCTFDTSGCYAMRFDVWGETVFDHETGLRWEKKDSADGVMNFANPHDVDNLYSYSNGGTAPDGGAFLDFLDKLNGGEDNTCYAGHCDWRLPTIEELQSIVDPSASDCGSGSPWIDPAFGPTQSIFYLSSSTYQPDPSFALVVFFDCGATAAYGKSGSRYVRAVRFGS